MKYIDSEKLIAEIERRKRFYERTHERLHQDDPEFSTSYAIASALKELRSFITSLQQEQPEVDLEKELGRWRHKHFKGKRDGDYSGEYLERESQLDLARHFYELGKNERKV